MTGRRETLTLQPDVLRWARERADFSVADLAQKVDVKAERVLRRENAGAISMPPAEKLARAIHTPPGYLFLSFPPVAELPVRISAPAPAKHRPAPAPTCWRRYMRRNGGRNGSVTS